MNFVYMVECADGSLYTGWTVDLAKRMKAHNDGKASKYTRSRRPVVLAYWEEAPTRGDALRREMEIKGLSRSDKLAIISGGQK